MSEQLHEEDTYTPRVEHASIYGEEQMLHDYSQWTQEALEAKAKRFIDMLNDPTTMSKHKGQVARLLDHVIFELNYREAEGIHG